MNRPLPQLSPREQLNFLLTNRVPRRLLTRFIGWYSQIESPWLAKISIAIWRLFAEDLRLDEAERTDFCSLRDCFTRRLKPGARPIAPGGEIVVSPCDAEIGQCGVIAGTTVYQAKGFPYELGELIPDPVLQERFRDGVYVSLRLKSSMYHRFHAPVDCRIGTIDYISGDTWNVNPPTLQRIEKLYCRNERAVLPLLDLPHGDICLVPVAAILVASMQLHGLATPLDLRYRGPNRIALKRSFRKGEEIGYFQQGSTILLFATANFALAAGRHTGDIVRMGEPLLIDTAPLSAPLSTLQAAEEARP